VTPQSRRISFVPQIVGGLIAAAALFVVFTLPPRAVRLAGVEPDARIAWGGYHKKFINHVISYITIE